MWHHVHRIPRATMLRVLSSVHLIWCCPLRVSALAALRGKFRLHVEGFPGQWLLGRSLQHEDTRLIGGEGCGIHQSDKTPGTLAFDDQSRNITDRDKKEDKSTRNTSVEW